MSSGIASRQRAMPPHRYQENELGESLERSVQLPPNVAQDLSLLVLSRFDPTALDGQGLNRSNCPLQIFLASRRHLIHRSRPIDVLGTKTSAYPIP